LARSTHPVSGAAGSETATREERAETMLTRPWVHVRRTVRPPRRLRWHPQLLGGGGPMASLHSTRRLRRARSPCATASSRRWERSSRSRENTIIKLRQVAASRDVACGCGMPSAAARAFPGDQGTCSNTRWHDPSEASGAQPPFEPPSMSAPAPGDRSCRSHLASSLI
jgi:hypothetical protein